MTRLYLWAILLLSAPLISVAQEVELDSAKQERIVSDSLFIQEYESPKSAEKPKVLHAEPLYIDLIRDLGARKGEKEWNVGVGMSDKRSFDEYEALIEYEWAVIDRLGLEVEIPVTIYSRQNGAARDITKPSNRIESLKLAAQWSFLVSEKAKSTLALGYIHEFELVDLDKMGQGEFFKGNLFNPFLIAAKRWGRNYHTLIYTGPRIVKEFGSTAQMVYEINTNFHYMISGTRNFVGMEINQEIADGRLFSVLRPQMRVGLAENLLVGIVTGIPLNREQQGLSSFLRIIYEPGGYKPGKHH